MNKTGENSNKKVNIREQTKYELIRAELDKLNFIKGFDLFSLELVSDLLNEISVKSREVLFEKGKNKVLEEKTEKQTLEINAFKYKIESVLKENKELHLEVINLLNKSKIIENSENNLKNVNEEVASLKFLVTELKNKIKELEKENFELKTKLEKLLTDLFEKTKNIKQLFLDKDEEDRYNKGHGQPITLQEFENNFFNLATVGPSIEISEFLNNQQAYPESINFDPNNDKNIFSTYSTVQFSNYGLNQVNYENMINELRNQNKNLEDQLFDKNNEVNVLKNQLKKYFNCDANFSNKNNNEAYILIDYLRNQLKTSKEKFDNYLKHIFEVNNINKLAVLYENKDQGNSTAQKEIQKIYRQNKKFISINQQLVNENANLKIQLNEVEKLNNVIKNLKAQINEYKLKLNKKFTLQICSKNCNLYINKSENEEKAKLIKNKNKMINQLNINIAKVQKEKNILAQQNKTLNVNIEKITKENESIKIENENIKEKFNSLKQNIFQEKNKNANQGELINKKEEEKSNLENNNNKLIKELEEKNNNIQLLNQQLILKDKEIYKIKEMNNILETELKMLK